MSLALGPNQLPIQYEWSAIYRGLKWPECEANRTAPSSAEVQNNRSPASAPWGKQREIYIMSYIKLVNRLLAKL